MFARPTGFGLPILFAALIVVPGAVAQGEPGGGEDPCDVGVGETCLSDGWGIDLYCTLGAAVSATGLDETRVSVLIGLVPGVDECFYFPGFAFAVVWYEYRA